MKALFFKKTILALFLTVFATSAHLYSMEMAEPQFPDFPTLCSELYSLFSPDPDVAVSFTDNEFRIKISSDFIIKHHMNTSAIKKEKEITLKKAPTLYNFFKNLAEEKGLKNIHFYVSYSSFFESSIHTGGQILGFRLKDSVIITLEDILFKSSNTTFTKIKPSNEIRAITEHELNHIIFRNTHYTRSNFHKITGILLFLSFFTFITSIPIRLFISNSKYLFPIMTLSLTMFILCGSLLHIKPINRKEFDKYEEETYADVHVSDPLAFAARFCRTLTRFPLTYTQDPGEFEQLSEVQQALSRDICHDPSDKHPPTQERIQYLIAEAKRRQTQT